MKFFLKGRRPLHREARSRNEGKDRVPHSDGLLHGVGLVHVPHLLVLVLEGGVPVVPLFGEPPHQSGEIDLPVVPARLDLAGGPLAQVHVAGVRQQRVQLLFTVADRHAVGVVDADPEVGVLLHEGEGLGRALQHRLAVRLEDHVDPCPGPGLGGGPQRLGGERLRILAGHPRLLDTRDQGDRLQAGRGGELAEGGNRIGVALAHRLVRRVQGPILEVRADQGHEVDELDLDAGEILSDPPGNRLRVALYLTDVERHAGGGDEVHGADPESPVDAGRLPQARPHPTPLGSCQLDFAQFGFPRDGVTGR